MKNVLALDASTGNWYMNWVVTPGPGGNNASAPPFGGGLIFDPTIDGRNSHLLLLHDRVHQT